MNHNTLVDFPEIQIQPKTKEQEITLHAAVLAAIVSSAGYGHVEHSLISAIVGSCPAVPDANGRLRVEMNHGQTAVLALPDRYIGSSSWSARTQWVTRALNNCKESSKIKGVMLFGYFKGGRDINGKSRSSIYDVTNLIAAIRKVIDALKDCSVVDDPKERVKLIMKHARKTLSAFDKPQSHNHWFQREKPSIEKAIERNIKTSVTYARKGIQLIRQESGEEAVDQYLSDLLRRIKGD